MSPTGAQAAVGAEGGVSGAAQIPSPQPSPHLGGAREKSWRHPRDLGAAEVRDYLSYLAVERKVAAATQRQALNALVFLYQEVLGRELGAIGELERPTRKVNVPTVLSQGEMRRVLAAVAPECGLICRLLYGTGLRLLECLRLRVHPVR